MRVRSVSVALAVVVLTAGQADARERDAGHVSTDEVHRIMRLIEGEPPTPIEPPAPEPVDCARQKCIALTFDDGPGPSTGQLLTILQRQDVRATFFVTGRNATARPGLVRRAAAQGHVIGNHSWSHPDLTALSARQVQRELARTTRAVRRAAGVRPTLARAPYGATNGKVARAMRRGGYAEILWTVDTRDWDNRSVRETTRRAVRGARPGRIILMHDIHPSTVRAVPRIITRLRARGYTFVTVPELLGATRAGRTYFQRPMHRPKQPTTPR